MEVLQSNDWLALVFAGLMGVSMLMYTILDGYDLGVGILLKLGTDVEKDRMISSIGPFWDANETWLVLAVGLLLVAFPAAHGLILTQLYLPVACMLVGLTLRGVAFDFRAKAKAQYKNSWNNAFFTGSLLAALSQGYMLGAYILGFDTSTTGVAFALLIGVCFVAAYALIGASWLIMKTEQELQKKAVYWAKWALLGTATAIFLISIATPIASERIYSKWFTFPNVLLLAPIPLATVALLVCIGRILRRLPAENDKWNWVPFSLTVAVYILCFHGLAYSFYPYIVPEQMKIVESASSPESLKIILVGTLIVFPVLIAYTVLAYKIFSGKAKDLRYD